MNITEQSNWAVQMIIKSARKVAEKGSLDSFDRAYFRGQFAALSNYFPVDIEALNAAVKEFNEMAAP